MKKPVEAWTGAGRRSPARSPAGSSVPRPRVEAPVVAGGVSGRPWHRPRRVDAPRMPDGRGDVAAVQQVFGHGDADELSDAQQDPPSHGTVRASVPDAVAASRAAVPSRTSAASFGRSRLRDVGIELGVAPSALRRGPAGNWILSPWIILVYRKPTTAR